jgi:hypothetical protein
MGRTGPPAAPIQDQLANRSYVYRILNDPRTGDAFGFRAAIQALAQKRASALFAGTGLTGAAPRLNDVPTGSPLLAGSWLSANLAGSAGAPQGSINVNPAAIWGLTTDSSPYHDPATNYVPHEMAHLQQTPAVLADQSVREGGAQAFADLVTPKAARSAGIPYRPGSYDSNYTGFAQQARQLGMQWLLKGQFGR